MEGALVVDRENDTVAANKTKGEKMAKGSMVGSVPRKRLADISNLPLCNQGSKPPTVAVNTKEYIDKLHQENMTLVKLLADKKKIIELSAIELQKLRINYQKVQQQNLQLAQANSQMLAELNSGRDKLKALQHELGCKNGLLKARKLESKEKAHTVRCQNYGNPLEIIECYKSEEFFQVEKGANESCDTKRKRQSKIRLLDPTTVVEPVPTTVVEPVQAKERVDKKRQSSRFKSVEQEPPEDLFEISDATVKLVQAEKNVDMKRLSSQRQPARFKSHEELQKPTKDLIHTEDVKFPVSPLPDNQIHENCPKSLVPSVKKESEAANSAAAFETQELRRSSVRPMRRAVEKIQSYKEIPLNVKMRRTE